MLPARRGTPNSEQRIGKGTGRNEASFSALDDPETYSVKYAVVIERGATSYGAHVPDFPGCVAAVETKARVFVLVHKATAFYLEALQADVRPNSRSAAVRTD